MALSLLVQLCTDDVVAVHMQGATHVNGINLSDIQFTLCSIYIPDGFLWHVISQTHLWHAQFISYVHINKV